MNPDELCHNCKFYSRLDGRTEKVAGEGICQRFPPVLTGSSAFPNQQVAAAYSIGWSQPLVSSETQCGEWRAAE